MVSLDMEDLRQLNLFQRVTGIGTRYCFPYNNMIIFCVPQNLVRVAVGENGRNANSISQIIKKRIRIIAQPESINDLKKFIEAIVNPISFKEIEIKGNEVILTSGKNSKASLIGRDKRRLIEMQKIIKDFFEKDFRII